MESREIMKFGNFEVAQGIVNFNEYEILKSEAQSVAKNIMEKEVKEDNNNESKKLQAKVNKTVNENQ
ncbi:MAG: hypothetical protein K0M69_00570, partial [Youngiibacter sp.]|nr:hypothetical protein [Youngiibacter sp.]